MTKVVGVRFRRAGKIYYFDPGKAKMAAGSHVIVETARGIEYGTVLIAPKEVDDKAVVQPLKPVIRVATPEDDKTEQRNKEKEKEAKKKSKEKNKTKQQKNETPINNRNNDKAGSSATAQGTLPKTVVSPALPVGYQEIGIFGEAVASKSQAVALLKQNNPDLKLTCSAEEIVDLYWQEASREGVRQDLAFAQALVETGFFRFGGDVKPEQNNFCGLGTTGGGVKGAHFKTPEIGVRAHIQHLLAYTTQKHPSTKIVDPRYDLAHAIRLERGLCDTWYKLNGTWAMSPNYSEKIMGVWQRMLGIEAVETKSEKYKNEHDKKDNKVKEEVNTTEDQHKMRELVDELLKKNK